MAINSLEAISKRAEELAFLESALRKGREQTGELSWPLGDLIRATVGDLRALVEHVRDDDGALANILATALRGLGYTVISPDAQTEPAPRDEDTHVDPPSDAPAASCGRCGTALPIPGGPCRYADCNDPAGAPTLFVEPMGRNVAKVEMPERRRAPEPEIRAGEWSPDEKAVAEMAVRLGVTADEAINKIERFRAEYADAPPQSRWRPTFVKWAGGA